MTVQNTTIPLVETQVLKVCSKCGESFPLTGEFWGKRKDSKDGYRGVCTLCASKQKTKYYYNNKDKIIKYQTKYIEEHKEKISNRGLIYRNINKDWLVEYHKEYRKINKDKINSNMYRYYNLNKTKLAGDKKKYYNQNKAKITKYKKSYLKREAKHALFFDKLDSIDKVRKSGDNLEVSCAYCGKWFAPSICQVNNRIIAIENTGGSQFYCSEGCKQSCPTYGMILYPKGFKNATSREVNPLVRQLTFKRDNYTCQKCGVTDTALHCHHIEGATQNPLLSNDTANCITFCRKCHKAIHKKPGCGYNELKCEAING